MSDTYNGKIIKGIAGFYYVYIDQKGLFECKAKGLFRKEKIKPLVGDNVLVSITDEANGIGNITDIEKRKNEIIRPACANIDMAITVMAISKPAPKFSLLDKIMVFFSYYDIPVTLCFNKCDEADDAGMNIVRERYKASGADVIFTSAMEGTGITELKSVMQEKTTVLTGPSGVGKSSILNRLCPDADLEVGDISRIGRGKHTTRHTEIFKIARNTFVMDTPGFTSLDIPEIPKEDLKFYFNEFSDYENRCRFDGCVHIHEPDCAVKDALKEGRINPDRYKSYCDMYRSIEESDKYRKG